MLHQSKRCRSGAEDALSKLVVIGWLSPVWDTLKLAVNDGDALRVAPGLSAWAIRGSVAIIAVLVISSLGSGRIEVAAHHGAQLSPRGT